MAEADLVTAAVAPVVQAATTLATDLVEVGAMAAGTRSCGTALYDAVTALLRTRPDDTTPEMVALGHAAEAWQAGVQTDFHVPGA